MTGLFDPFQAAVRHALEFDPVTRDRLAALDGKVVEIQLTGVDHILCVAIEDESVWFSRTPGREPDLRLTGTPVAFARYLLSPDRVEITESGIKIEGDIGLARRFAGLLRNVDIDWEEWASRYVGDVAAYRAGRLAEALRAWARDSSEQTRQDITEYLQEEARLLAPRQRVKRFLDDVDTTRSDVERLAQRIKRLRNSG